jgi:hypothetical protein
MKIRTKKTIEAEQFLPPHKIPKGVFNVYELSEGVFSGQLWHQGERINIRPGDWIVENPDSSDKYSAINNEVFLEKYEPVPGTTTKEKIIVGEDMICPITGQHCDDECCTVGSECNLSGDEIHMAEPETTSLVFESIERHKKSRTPSPVEAIESLTVAVGSYQDFLEYLEEKYNFIQGEEWILFESTLSPSPSSNDV